MTTDMEPIPLI